MHDKSSRDDNQVVGMFCFRAQAEFFVSEVLATLDSRRILLSRMRHNIATAQIAAKVGVASLIQGRGFRMSAI